MKRFIAAFAILCLLTASASAGSILPSLGTADQILYAPALRGVSELETPTPSDRGGGDKEYSYNGVSLNIFEAFSLALARAGYALDASETEEESGNINSEVSGSGIRLKIVYNPDNERMTVIYPKGVLPSPDEATDTSLIRDASMAEGILPANIVRFAPSIPQVSFLTAGSPTALPSGGQRYTFKPVKPVIYERYSAKLGEEGYALISAEQDEGTGGQVLVVGKGNIELTLRYNSGEEKMMIDYPQRVRPAEGDLSEYTRPLVVDEVFDTGRSGLKASVTTVTTVSQYTEDWRQSTPWFTRTSSSTYKAETDDEVFLWMSFLTDNQSADFTSRYPYSSLNVKLITEGTETSHKCTYNGASSRVGYVNTRSSANGPIAPQTQAGFQSVIEIPRAEFEAAEELYAEIITCDYAWKYVVCIRGENGQLKQE